MVEREHEDSCPAPREFFIIPYEFALLICNVLTVGAAKDIYSATARNSFFFEIITRPMALPISLQQGQNSGKHSKHLRIAFRSQSWLSAHSLRNGKNQ